MGAGRRCWGGSEYGAAPAWQRPAVVVLMRGSIQTGAAALRSGIGALWRQLRNLDARLDDGVFRIHDVGEMHAIIFREHAVEPMADVASEHKGVAGRLAVCLFVGDEGSERH